MQLLPLLPLTSHMTYMWAKIASDNLKLSRKEEQAVQKVAGKVGLIQAQTQPWVTSKPKTAAEIFLVTCEAFSLEHIRRCEILIFACDSAFLRKVIIISTQF